MQDCISSNKIKENKYKILRMSLILGADDNREETINNFEEAAREIDAMNDETYIKELEDKFYDTLKLEEEEKKLAVLVDYIGGRVEQRISLLSDFANVTGYDLSNLPPIKYYDKLDDYKERLKYIREYLENIGQIEQLTTETEEAETKLKEAYLNKATSEECNQRNEEILLNKFKNILKTIPSFKEITESNLEEKLEEIIVSVNESKKSLDIFTKSFTTLSGSGISFEEEQEYKSYVDNAKDLYYQNKEQEYLLRIYSHLLLKESEYSQILSKRESINQLLCERLDLRRELLMDDIDVLSPIYDILDKQYSDIERQKTNIEDIEYLNNSIELKKEQLKQLEEANQKVEILSLLREFCIIDTYTEIEDNLLTNNIEIESSISSTTEEESSKDIEIPNEIPEPIIDAPKEIPKESETKKIPEIEEKYEENEVISVESATNIDLELVRSKASKVMNRVGEMLGIKTEETKIISVENQEPVIEENNLNQKIIPEQESIKNPLPEENPLFNNNLTELPIEESKQEEENSFWFSSDTPDALNELPDLTVSNDNFFANNEMPDLNFPDLKIDFGNNDLEGNK